MEMTINLKAPINKFWKEYLGKYTGPSDVGSVSNDTGVGFFTVKRLRLGEINISNEENKKAVEALVKVAIKNATSTKEKAEDAETKMKENIANIFDCI